MNRPAPAQRTAAPPPPQDEAELVRRLKSGDRQAFAALVALHGGGLLRLAMTFMKDKSLAQEIVQDTWLAALDGIETFEGRSALRTWLFHITANKARTRLSREGRSVPFSSLTSTDDDDAGVSPDRFDQRGMWKDPPGPWSEENPERLAQGAQTRAVIEQAIAQLPDSQRAVITLRDIEELDPDEICGLLGITLNNQRVLLHRARTKVRMTLEAYMAGAR
jgi:RNA polymerase sigma-70 factor (ECF subfamily)